MKTAKQFTKYINKEKTSKYSTQLMMCATFKNKIRRFQDQGLFGENVGFVLVIIKRCYGTDKA